MQTGKDDEDLQKALTLSLEPVEDWRHGWSLYVWVEDFNRVKPGSHEVWTIQKGSKRIKKV